MDTTEREIAPQIEGTREEMIGLVLGGGFMLGAVITNRNSDNYFKKTSTSLGLQGLDQTSGTFKVWGGAAREPRLVLPPVILLTSSEHLHLASNNSFNDLKSEAVNSCRDSRFLSTRYFLLPQA